MNLFYISFTDNTEFEGGEDVFHSKWKDIPRNKKIKTLFYRLSETDYIAFSGYDKYYHMVEACKDLNGVKSGEVQIEYIYLIGIKNEKASIRKINYRTGKIELKEYAVTDKFITSLNPENWR